MMAEGFLLIYFGMVMSWTLLGVIIGIAFANKNRKKGAIIGAIIGITLGSVLATVTSFEAPASKVIQPIVLE